MALKLGWFAVKDVDGRRIGAVLEDARRHVARDAQCPHFRVLDPGTGWTSIAVLLNYANVNAWAQEVSRIANAKTASFFVFEGTWTCVVFEHGERLSERSESPEDEWEHVDVAKTLGPIAYPDPTDARVFEIDWRPPPRKAVSRPLVASDVDTVISILRERGQTDEPFAVYFPRWMEIARSGTASELADVYRELSLRPADRLSFGEKRILETVRERLLDELAPALGCSKEEARAVIEREVAE